MAILGRPEGIFDLNDSDKCGGSYLTRGDVKEILQVNDNNLSIVNFKTIDNGYFYDGQTRERNNREHPIIEKIKSGYADVGLIIPKGSSDRNLWLTEKLKK
jgi:hypothetical protein